MRVHTDINAPDEPHGLCVLLHPHPDFGGNRFHPFIDTMFLRLPEVAVASVRFDFSSSDPSVAHKEVLSAMDQGSARWPDLPVVLVGYSFGAGVAVDTADERIAAWYLLAPPTAALSGAAIGQDARPKAIVVRGARSILPSGGRTGGGRRLGCHHGHSGAGRRSLRAAGRSHRGCGPRMDRKHHRSLSEHRRSWPAAGPSKCLLRESPTPDSP